MDKLFCDLKTDEEKGNFFLSGRAYETGVIAKAIQNDVAMAYHRCAEYAKEIERLNSGAAQRPENTHIDDDAVDHFAVAMKDKLAQARAKGRSRWFECDPADLSAMLRDHVEKGDPRDVANFCMFLWSLGKPISTAPVAAQAQRVVNQQMTTAARDLAETALADGKHWTDKE